MRAILIDPFDKTITEVDSDGSLSDIYRLIGCSDINAIAPDRTHHIYVDGEGLLKDPPLPVFNWQGFSQPFAGRGLMFCLGKEGEEIAATMPIGVAYAHVTFPALMHEGMSYRSGTLPDGTPYFGIVPHFKRTGKE